MKLLLSTGVYPPQIGGPSAQAQQMAVALGGRGVDVSVLTWGERAAEEMRDGVRVLTLGHYEGAPLGPLVQYGAAAPRLLALLRRERPQLVHHLSGCDYLCVLLAAICRVAGVPAVVKYAGDLVWETLVSYGATPASYEDVFTSTRRGRLLARVERWAFSQYARIWATSGFQRDSLVRILGVDPARVHEMPNFISIPHQEIPQRTSAAPVVLAASRFAPWKRVGDVLEAFAASGVSESRLRLVGGGNPEIAERLHRRARSLGVQDRVTLVGPVAPHKMAAEFRNADVFVSAADYEPFGIVLVEAMSWGLPIAAARTGGVPEVVTHGEAGILVPPGDVPALAGALRTLLLDPALRQRMGHEGAHLARRFDLESNLKRLLDFYSVALAQPK